MDKGVILQVFSLQLLMFIAPIKHSNIQFCQRSIYSTVGFEPAPNDLSTMFSRLS
jgi:hypothetical protein